MKPKLILAFSGGLDTSFCVVHLSQKYDVITATINSGGFSDDELIKIEQKAKEYGAIKHYTIDVQEEIFNTVINFVIQFNAKYEQDYPLMCADRYIISEKIIKIARDEKANYVAHGSTSSGNDQVRFDTSIKALAPELEIITPIKELHLTRDQEIKFLLDKGFEIKAESKKYSINQNVFGNTLSGSEIDMHLEPKNEVFQLTKIDKDIKPNTVEYFEIEYKNGIPISIDGKQQKGLNILKTLDTKVGKFGWGRNIYNGDCIIGIKGRIAFEAPGLLALIEGHRKLEQYTLTKSQIKFNQLASEQWTNFVYSGLFYEPLKYDLEAYILNNQKCVSGKVKFKLELNSLNVVEIKSPFTLTNEKIASYAQKANWSNKDADGFIKLYGLQQQIATQRDGTTK